MKNNDERFNVAAKAVREVIGAMPSGTIFNGWELKTKCVELYPGLVNMYVETFLREMRAYCKDKYILMSRNESKYKKIGDPIKPITTTIKRPELKKYETLYQPELFEVLK